MFAAALHLLKRAVGMAVKPADHKRSSRWPAARAAWLKDHPACAACGSREKVEVHHKVPFHLNPDRELDTSNFITLCDRPGRNCHFRYGHDFSWSDYNPCVELDAARELERLRSHKPRF